MDEINQAYLAYAQKIADELNLGKVVVFMIAGTRPILLKLRVVKLKFTPKGC